MATFGGFTAHATIPDSAYASAVLELTSSNSQELATGSATASAGYADAQAQPGSMENSIMTKGSAGESSTAFQNESVSGFSDTFTINDPALIGTSGTMEFNFLVNGTESFTATAPAISSITTAATFTGPGGPDDLSFTEQSPGVVTSGSDFLGMEQTVNVPFIFGTPFTIDLTVDITALVEGLTGSGSAMTSGSFSTLAGEGTVTPAVLDSPLPASSYTVKSASGANYLTVTPVPEPDGLFLAMAGLAALPLVKMWRRGR